MIQKGYTSDFHNNFEQLKKKIDNSNETISNLLLNNSILFTEIKNLSIKLDESNTKN